MALPSEQPQNTVNIAHLLDEGPFTPFQFLVVVLAAATGVFDGLANQIIGFAIPSIAREWAISPGTLAPAVAAGLFGMGLGSAFIGLYADRFGRRSALLASILVFGAFTCLVSVAAGVVSLSLLRFIASLGVGGAVPIYTTLTAEFTPVRHRTLAVTTTAVCYPLGGIVAGLFATRSLAALGWRTLFLDGGAAALALLVALFLILPESPRFLARRPHRWHQLRRLLEHMSRPVAPGTEFTDPSGFVSARREGFGSLFSANYRRNTIALWCSFFASFVTIYTVFSWLPTMLVSAGLPGTIASSGLTAWNLGGVLGAIVCAIVVGRLGSRWPMLACCATAAAVALLLSRVELSSHTSLLIAGIAANGFFVNAVQSVMFALAAHVYPTSVRATGVASAMAFGRLGAVLSAFAGAAVIVAAGASGYLLMLAATMTLAAIAIACIRHHIPPLNKSR
jgi:AAHS family 4-hydroxybenzoate transporter-like MFS transporter